MVRIDPAVPNVQIVGIVQLKNMFCNPNMATQVQKNEEKDPGKIAPGSWQRIIGEGVHIIIKKQAHSHQHQNN